MRQRYSGANAATSAKPSSTTKTLVVFGSLVWFGLTASWSRSSIVAAVLLLVAVASGLVGVLYARVAQTPVRSAVQFGGFVARWARFVGALAVLTLAGVVTGRLGTGPSPEATPTRLPASRERLRALPAAPTANSSSASVNAYGTAARPPETRATYSAESSAPFAELTASEHLSAARDALNSGYEPSLRVGGELAIALRHLNAIPDSARESVMADALLQEIAERDARASNPLHVPAALTCAQAAQLRRDASAAALATRRRLARAGEGQWVIWKIRALGVGYRSGALAYSCATRGAAREDGVLELVEVAQPHETIRSAAHRRFQELQALRGSIVAVEAQIGSGIEGDLYLSNWRLLRVLRGPGWK